MRFGLIILNDRLEDDETKYCGGDYNDFPFYSAYILDSSNTDDVPNYKYFQCVKQELYSDPKDVLSGELVLTL